jgi:hypothetical protein
MAMKLRKLPMGVGTALACLGLGLCVLGMQSESVTGVHTIICTLDGPKLLASSAASCPYCWTAAFFLVLAALAVVWPSHPADAAAFEVGT